MHYFEFGVTPFIDWREVQTIYVKANSSSEAIRYLLTLTNEDNESFPFADFKFRTALPECCMSSDPVIYYAPSK